MMDNREGELTESEIRKKAYLAGMRLKSSGHDADTIYAKLEKQGFTEKLAMEAVRDLMIEKNMRLLRKQNLIIISR